MSKLTLSMQQAESILQNALAAKQFPTPSFAAHAAIWLEACGYPGLQTLWDATADPITEFNVHRDKTSIDLQNISCARVGEHIVYDVLKNGRTRLCHVRHGLFLVPASVVRNLSIGCAVDAGFAFGGARTKNPYLEKLDMAAEAGVHFDKDLWNMLTRTAA